jgi:hypothetical protein
MDDVTDPLVPGSARPDSLSSTNHVASAIGTAMLGLEQAMRRDPPAEVIVREHQPERGHSGADGDFDIVFPEALVPDD